jgi:nitrite reductase [NAD(P)H] small subunit
VSALPEAAPWTLVGRVGDVPELEGRSVTVAGRRIAIFRLADRWAAVDGDCPHRGGPLSDGIVAERCVVCPLHARRFDLITGAPLGTGEGEGGLTVHEVREERGRLYLRLLG